MACARSEAEACEKDLKQGGVAGGVFQRGVVEDIGLRDKRRMYSVTHQT